jgi:2-polyprenyl-3-methyl-5-hydroxy-6-metoxy-1,4-benzoquinol methylase
MTHDCNICGSTETKSIDGYTIVPLQQCPKCSGISTIQRPTEKELTSFYQDELTRSNYFSPITVKRYHTLLDSLEKYRSTNKILDIGAGQGYFLEIAKERGWEVYGTEFSSDCIIHSKKNGIDLHQGNLKGANFSNEQFDVVVCIEVIEHLINPKETTDEMHRILRKGGAVYITTPNFNAIHRYRLKEQYDVITYPTHLSYFTRKSIKNLFQNSGLSSKRIWTTGYSFTRLRTRKGKSNQDYVSETSDDEMLRHRMENNPFLRAIKSIINGVLNLFKIGDSLKGIFVKR